MNLNPLNSRETEMTDNDATLARTLIALLDLTSLNDDDLSLIHI